MANGTDGILFPAGKTLEPWRLVFPVDPFNSRALFRNANCTANHWLTIVRL